jgi:thiosulfate dehydrogenase [quinone] large subunit
MVQSTLSRFINQATKERPIGVVLLPLRIFLGVTFIYAGLLKLSSADFLSATAPNGVLKQMQHAVIDSPISFIVQHAVEHYQLAGLSIALGELFVGIGILFGIWTRVAAVFAFILSASFWLTVSWTTSPYFFGPDIIFMASVTPLIIAGDGGHLSVGARIRSIVERQLKAPGGAQQNAPLQAEIDRRTLVRTGAVAGVLAGGGLLAGGVGRIFSKQTQIAAPAPSHSVSAKPGSGAPKGGIKIASASAVSIGSSFQFNDKQGSPAFLMQPAKGRYLAYSAICTHNGCVVGFDTPSDTFQCPCHGASYDGKTGAVLGGPTQLPLTKIQVVEFAGDIYMV